MVLPTVLFVCSGNACASPMAEAYLNTIAGGAVRAFSAGIEPAERVDGRTLKALAVAGLPTDGLAPKALEVFAMPQAPAPDLLVVLSAAMLGRAEPLWQRPPHRLSWFLPEPGREAGTGEFVRLLEAVRARIDRALADGVFGLARPLERAV